MCRRWISCKPSFLPPVGALSRLLWRLMLEKLAAAHAAGQLQAAKTPRTASVASSRVPIACFPENSPPAMANAAG
jgi:hypothetical protein